ncbi:MAG TPA: hypothetical protein VLR26_00270 [Frankiaceae bacterium]|nr:hypothetical protein [Frankiaceae bacterium]
MTSDTRDLSTTEQPPHRPDRVQLSAVQVAASALASVSAAVVASLFGVAGTIVGAGLVAVLSTTGSAIYSSSMKRTSNQLRRAREQLLTARAGDSTIPGRRPTRSNGAGRTIDLTDGADTTAQARKVEGRPVGPQSNRWHKGWLTVGSRRGLKWPALVGAVVLVFAIAIGAITAFEAITQKPISSLTGHNSSSSTTIGSLTQKSAPTPKPKPKATQSGSGSDAGTTTPSAGPSVTSSSRGSTKSQTPASATPRPSASAAPTSAAPKPSSRTGTGSGTGSGGSGQGLQAPTG